jgi:hypothetical protein
VLGRLISIAPFCRAVERPLEADVGTVLRSRMGANRMADGRDAAPRFLQLSFITLYAIPRTSVLGAVLMTGYLGGAIATYVRIGEFSPPLVPLGTACSRGPESICASHAFARCCRFAETQQA